MAAPEITDNPAKSHHHPTRCCLNLPHPPALMKLMEGISDMLFLLCLSLSHCHLFNDVVAADVRGKVLMFFPPAGFSCYSVTEEKTGRKSENALILRSAMLALNLKVLKFIELLITEASNI